MFSSFSKTYAEEQNNEEEQVYDNFDVKVYFIDWSNSKPTPITNETVSILHMDGIMEYTTNDEGYITLENISSGSYWMKIEYFGFRFGKVQIFNSYFTHTLQIEESEDNYYVNFDINKARYRMYFVSSTITLAIIAIVFYGVRKSIKYKKKEIKNGN